MKPLPRPADLAIVRQLRDEEAEVEREALALVRTHGAAARDRVAAVTRLAAERHDEAALTRGLDVLAAINRLLAGPALGDPLH